jgi:hypothetical protein
MSASIIEQLQIDSIDRNAPVTDLLRKAKLVAAKLKAADFAQWVEFEINGYGEGAKLPLYRHAAGELKYLNPYNGWQPIMGMRMGTQQIRAPMALVTSLLELSSSGYFHVGVRPELAERICSQLGFPADVKIHVPKSALAGIIEAARNAVMDWALKLDEAGVKGEGLSFTKEEAKAASTVGTQFNIYGPVGGLAHGGGSISSITQTISPSPQEIAEAVGSLVESLSAMGSLAPAAASGELREAEAELRAGRLPLAKIRAALGAIKDAQDIAVRAPEAASKAAQLGSWLGLW